MARWKLTEKHYLKVPGTKWELQQIDRSTGRPNRKVFDVPLYLDPDADGDWNRREGYDGFITVCHEGKGHEDGRDIVFIGDPTPGMLPLDAEAREITARFSWTPTQGTDEQSQENSFQQKLLIGLIDQMSDLQTKATAAPMGQGFEKLMEGMMAMMAQQTEILARLVAPPVIIPAPMADEQVILEPQEDLFDEPPSEAEIAEASRIAAEKEAASVAKATARAASRRV